MSILGYVQGRRKQFETGGTNFGASGVTERLGALGHIDTLGPNLTQDRIPELLINLSKSTMVLFLVEFVSK